MKFTLAYTLTYTHILGVREGPNEGGEEWDSKKEKIEAKRESGNG